MRVAVSLLTLLALSIPVPGFALTPAQIDAAATVARQIDSVTTIASDTYLGRDNNTAASAAVQTYLIGQLSPYAAGLNSGQTGSNAYRQPFTLLSSGTPVTGTNLLAVIPGTDLASQYVMIGAHYDHFGVFGGDIYNGATDNAAGVAIVLATAKAIASLPTPPRRSVIFALWDAEEDGLIGSAAYVATPIVPLSSTVAYVNLDIQGANLLPSLRGMSFAIAAESGGATLQNLVQAQIGNESVGTRQLTRMFGQERSDHATFINSGVPSVFFSDGPGGCYHTPEDDPAIVDLGKLRKQSQVAFRTTVALAEAVTPPPFVNTTPTTNTYQDAVQVQTILGQALDDLALFTPSQQATLTSGYATLQGIVAGGPGGYDTIDQVVVANSALSAFAAVETLTCNGFLLANPIPTAPPPARIGLVLALAALSCAAAWRATRRGARG